MKSEKKILLINFGGIGDEILFLPVISALKKKYPASKIALCFEGRSKAFLSLTNLVDNYFFVDIKTKNKYIEMLKLYFKALLGKFDIVLSSGSNPLISLLLFFTGIKIRIGFNTSKIAEKLLTHPVKLNKNQYASLMYYDLAKSILDIPFELPKIDLENVEKEQNSIIIHPGVSKISVKRNIIKTINPEMWSQIIIRLLKKGKKVYLAGGPDDIECIEKIRNYLKQEKLENFFDLFGETKNIYDLAVLIKKSEILVCSDSAPMHIGICTNTKTFAIFGPTNEKLLLPPHNNNFNAITNNVECRPCLWNNRQTTCSELKCLDFKIDDIIEQILVSFR